MEWYLKVFRQYSDFESRARRKEYWMFLLVNLVVSMVVGVAGGTLQGLGVPGASALSWAYAIVAIVPSIAVGARRLHDIGRSGWWQLIALVPLVGVIVLLFWAAADGMPGSNLYGANPKEAMA